MQERILFILLFTLLGSIASLSGILLMASRHDLAQRVSLALVSLAAGTLLATSLLHLFPEALELAGEEEHASVFFFVLFGIVVFFLVERFLLWFHHHHERESDVHPAATLVLIGDGVHNFIDGVVIATSFFVSIPLGIVTAFAVVLHEIPQEIGDMAVLLHAGIARKRAIFFNFLTALTAFLGAGLAIVLKEEVIRLLPILLSLTAGFFLYIAASDLIPQLHRTFAQRGALTQTILFLAGIIIVYLLNTLLLHA